MGKGSTLKKDELIERAEQVRAESAALLQELAALRELRTLERDFRRVARKLAMTMNSVEITGTADGLQRMVSDAEEILAPSGRQ